MPDNIVQSLAPTHALQRAFSGGSVVKNLQCRRRGFKTRGISLGWGKSPGEGNGYPVWYSCLQNPMDRGACRATVLGVAKESDTTWWLNNNIPSKEGERSRDPSSRLDIVYTELFPLIFQGSCLFFVVVERIISTFFFLVIWDLCVEWETWWFSSYPWIRSLYPSSSIEF